MGRKFYFGLLIVLLLPVVLISGCIQQEEQVKPQESKLTEEQFKGLLTIKDVEKVLVSQVELNTKFYDYKKMAESEDPEQVAAMDSFYGLSFQTEDGMKAMTLMAIDFDSTSSAQQHFQKVKIESELESMEKPIGDSSFEKELGLEGIGSVVIFLKGDKVIQLHTTMPEGEKPIVDLKGLEELAKKVEEKL